MKSAVNVGTYSHRFKHRALPDGVAAAAHIDLIHFLHSLQQPVAASMTYNIQQAFIGCVSEL